MQMLLFRPTAMMVKILTLGFLILSLLDPALPAAAPAPNPQQPLNSTWQVLTNRRDVIWSASKITGQPWWPDLYPDLCKLATLTSPDWHMDDQPLTVKAPNLYDSYHDPRPRPPGCANSAQRKKLATQRFYVCPGSHRDSSLLHKCGGTEDYFCRSWGCETTGNTYWSPSSSWDFITVSHNYSLGHINTYAGAPECGDWCHPLKIQFTDPGKRAMGWETGFTWGLRLYQEGRDTGVIFTIKLIKQPANYSHPLALGPDPILNKHARHPDTPSFTPDPFTAFTPSPLATKDMI